MSLKDFITKGLEFGITDLENPVFTFNGTDYACVPSVNTFKRELASGGFATETLLSMTVPLVDDSDNSLFTVLPTAQQIVTYNGVQYRIQSVNKHPTGAYLRLIATSITRGL